MAVLSTKHARQQQYSVTDFSGGLNTSTSMSGIETNQLYDVLNMELDSVTNRLKTTAGTVDVLTTDITIVAAAWDEINKKMILVDADKKVYASSLTGLSEIGTLSGTLYPICANWEDGLLIASGGKLQYYNGSTLATLDASPNSTAVYTRAGRVVVTTENEVHYSAVGDETDWTEDTNSAASSVWIEAGYKDGGKFVGMASLSQDMLIFKNNRRVYRLSGEYPDWSVVEVSRNVECASRTAFAAIADTVIVLGNSEVQALSPTSNYGDVKPEEMGARVTRELAQLAVNTRVRYLPPLSQIWFIGANGIVLVLDVTHNAWFKRKFNSNIVDVIAVGNTVYVVKPDRISKLSDSTFFDNGKPLIWKFQAKRIESHNDYLLKRTQISIMPYSSDVYSGYIKVGGVVLPLPIPKTSLKIYGNHAKIYKNRTKIYGAGRSKGLYVSGEPIYQNLNPIYGNKTKIFTRRDIIRESRNVFRSKYLVVEGHGTAGGFLLNGIALDLVEV